MESEFMPATATPLPTVQRVLALAPHADDEVFGCGGTLHGLARAGAVITVIVASDGALGGVAGQRGTATLIAAREAETRAAATVLGYPAPVFWRLPDRGLRYGEALVAKLLESIQAQQPDLVFAPALTELHPDHQALALAAAEALRRLGGERRIAFYEVSAPLLPNSLFDITACEEQKRAAMRCFRTQLAEHPYDERIAALNRYRAYTLGADVKAAEAFFMVTAAELANGLAPLFESALGHRRRLGAAVEGEDLPLVSVIVRSMDRPTLAQALTSVAAQTYPNVEVLVVNAKGGPHTPLPDLSDRLVIRLIEKGTPLDRSRAANAGLDASRGVYVALLDDDDTLDPDHLGTLVATLRKEGNGVVAYSGVRGMDRNDPEHKISRVFGEAFECKAKLLAGNFIPSHAVLLPRRLVENGARFDETLGVYEDWDFWLQLAEVARFVYVDRVTATYFTGGSSAVSPLAFDADAVRVGMRALFAKWNDRITPDDLKAMCDLYLGCNAELLGARGEVRRLVDRVSDIDAHLVDTQTRFDNTQVTLQLLTEQHAGQLAQIFAEREAESQRLEDRIDDYASKLEVKERIVESYVHRLAATEASLAQVYASRSWRLTQPIRAATGMLRRSIHLALRSAYRFYTRR
jgi:LmbE family N-acetylglucosaminyl deacetylase/glycosyltransferase involved in cell wall biosynthesis